MSERRAQRLFTLDEANELVPTLSNLFSRLEEERSRLDVLLPEIERAAAKAIYGGGSVDGRAYVNSLERIAELLGEVADLGVLVKDPESGLCDFPCERDGDLVLLCWKQGEPEVSWWHGLDTGYRDRRSIEELPGMADIDPPTAGPSMLSQDLDDLLDEDDDLDH